MAVNAGSVYAELVLDTSKYEKALNNAKKQTDDLAKRLEKTGKNMEKVGKNLSKYVTAPIVAMGTFSTKAAIDFESAFAGVRKTVDATEQEFAALEKGIRDMSKRMPQSASEIAAVAEAAGQLGIKTENILSFTETMIMLGDTTNMTSEEAATALARLANITRMPQSEFDRLGSTIVALGNNLATTESEIVEMGLRLAGTASQVGMTEDQILALAGAMSSVGINAEAGGSSMSRVIQKINTEVLSSGKKLQKFAEIAGMSAEEFSKAWKERPSEAILAFIKGLDRVNKSGGDVTSTLKELGINSIQEIDTLLRLAGANETLADALGISAEAWDENTALTKEAEQRYQTTASQLQIAKNHLQDAAITIGEMVVPYLLALSEKIKDVATWFKNLNPETQKTIVKMAALVAAGGPVLSFSGKLIKGISKTVSWMGKLSGATEASTTVVASLGNAAAIGNTKVGGLGLAAKASTLLLNPWTAAIAAGGLAVYGLYKNLSEDAIPSIDLFGDSVSENTQKAVGSFLELEEQATKSLNQLAWSGQEVTGEMAESIIGNFEGMKEQVVGKLEEQKERALASISEMVENSIGMTEKEKEEMIRIIGESYDEQIKKTEEGNARIREILEKAKEEKRALTEEEKNEINRIKEEMKNDGIRILSESEKEHLAIMERLKQESGKISALQAAEIVKNSKEQKEKTIAEAEKEYEERLKYAAELRASGSKEAEKMADKIVEEAKRQRDEAIKNAEEMHNKVVEQAKLQAGEHVNLVDWETGEVKTKWEVMKGNITRKAKEIKEDVTSKWREIKKSTAGNWEEIRSNISTKWSNIKANTSTTLQGIKNNVVSKWEEIKTNTSSKWNSIKNNISEKVGNIKEKIISSITESEREWNSKTAKMESTKSRFSRLASKVTGAFDRIKGSVKNAVNAILDWNRTSPKNKTATYTTVHKTVSAKSGGASVRAYARGTNFHPGGLALVGEEGPELIELPRGSKVYTANETANMLGLNEERLANAIVKALKNAGLSKPAIMELDGRAVGKGIVNIIDAELYSHNTEDAIGRGQLEW